MVTPLIIKCGYMDYCIYSLQNAFPGSILKEQYLKM